ncbi:MAG: hypothetical protein FWG65_12825 [Turicibacter sp.]|nr:hypothetical protein [Turicibacter sp.]
MRIEMQKFYELIEKADEKTRLVIYGMLRQAEMTNIGIGLKTDTLTESPTVEDCRQVST